jgi:hypothetical protein
MIDCSMNISENDVGGVIEDEYSKQKKETKAKENEIKKGKSPPKANETPSAQKKSLVGGVIEDESSKQKKETKAKESERKEKPPAPKADETSSTQEEIALLDGGEKKDTVREITSATLLSNVGDAQPPSESHKPSTVPSDQPPTWRGVMKENPTLGHSLFAVIFLIGCLAITLTGFKADSAWSRRNFDILSL